MFLLSLFLAGWSSVEAATLRESQSENPIRRIVSLLQGMQKEIETEGEKEEEVRLELFASSRRVFVLVLVDRREKFPCNAAAPADENFCWRSLIMIWGVESSLVPGLIWSKHG